MFAGLVLSACSGGSTSTVQKTVETSASVSSNPASQFDLSHWKLTLPTTNPSDGKVANVNVEDLQSYTHPDFFYLDEQNHMVFTAPNKGGTTRNSSNTRSELRYMIRGDNQTVKTHGPLNNFALASHPDATEFGSIGGRMAATLHVDHAPLNAHRPNDKSSYAGVIGQIHAVKFKKPGTDYGYGNEPLKIIYKKWPEHETGSVYWHYERNLVKGHPDKRDIDHLVWGKDRADSADPGESGIALGEDFSYVVNVYEDTMYLTFDSPRLGQVTHEINLANNVDPNGRVDSKDNPLGYAKDTHYFKAGVYNQCRQASFSKLSVTKAVPQ